jgi:hypothetical protein
MRTDSTPRIPILEIGILSAIDRRRKSVFGSAIERWNSEFFGQIGCDLVGGVQLEQLLAKVLVH